jgi:hypothetical protein
MVRQFSVLRASTLQEEKQAHDPRVLSSFHKWPTADWRGRTLALR